MQIIYSQQHKQHQSPYEIWNGEQTSHQEIPARVENILASLKKNDFQISKVSQQVPSRILESIHEPEYLRYLENFRCMNETQYQYPSVFGLKTNPQAPTNKLAQQGFYTFDMYTPLSDNTYQAALDSANCAYQAAQIIHSKKDKVAYALCRPPGHHAEPSQMGGYCYLNNAAVASQFLSSFGKVAILDIDFHHGNGTQHIFYSRSDVLTISIHAHPEWKFPHISGFENETGVKNGQGFNINKTLQKGTGNNQYQVVLESVLEEIKKFKAQYLVVSFGADTHKDDPIGGFSLTSEYFIKMGTTINQLGIPTTIVQEGGYNTKLLGQNVSNFLNGFS